MNTQYKSLIAILTTLIGSQDWQTWIWSALEANGTPRSKSAVHGWQVSPSNKNYRPMTADDFQDVLDAVYDRVNNGN